MDAADGRFIPSLTVSMALEVRDIEVGTWDLPFLWHPTMFHYGRSVTVPEEGDYRATVTVEAPTFARHDKVNGRRYENAVRATFEVLRIVPGRK